jgi:hypothetical protein
MIIDRSDIIFRIATQFNNILSYDITAVYKY